MVRLATDARQAVGDMFAQIHALHRKVARLEAGQHTPQLPHTALDNATLPIYDEAGDLRLQIGKQPDGSYGLSTPATATAPGQPSTPSVTPATAGLAVAWDGLDSAGQSPNTDFSHVEVHVSTDEDEAPNPASLRGVLYRAGEVTVAPLDEVTQYVCLVGYNTAGDNGETSVVTTATPAAVVSTDILDGIVTTLKLADDAVTEAKIAAGAVGETQIQDDSITTPKIVAGAVAAEQIAAGAIDADKIAAQAITSAKIEALAVTADKLAANAVTAGKVDAGAVTAGTIAAGAITANTLEAVLQLVTRLVAGDPNANRVEINAEGIYAYDPDDTPTVNISSGDGSLAITGTYDTSDDGSSWSLGSGGLWTPPGPDTDAGPIGNPGSQMAWVNDGDIRAFIEARIDDSLRLRNNYGDIHLLPAPDGSAYVRSSDPAGGNLYVAGRLQAVTPTHRRYAVTGTTAIDGCIVSGTYATSVTMLSGVEVNTGEIVWDPANGWFTIPRSALYNIEAMFNWINNTTGMRYMEFFNVTQNRVITAVRQMATNSWLEQQCSARSVPLSAGDNIRLRVYQSATAASGSLNPGWRAGGPSATQPAACTFAIQYAGELTPTAADPLQTLVVHPYITDSYQYGSQNLWRAGDQVYFGNPGNGNHRGMLFYGDNAFAALAGKTIDKVTMYVRRTKDEGASDAIRPQLRGHSFGTHSQSSSEAPTMSGAYPDYGFIGDGWKRGQYKFVDLPNQVAIDLAGLTGAQAGGPWKGLMFEDTGGGQYGRYSKWSAQSTTANGSLTIIYH